MLFPPLPANELGPDDSLAFAKVTAAGMTVVSDPPRDYPAFYRDLKRNYRIQTTAGISGNVLLGTRSNVVVPWDSTKVYWWGAKGTEPFKPIRPPEQGKLLNTPAGRPIPVFGSLIEKLNVRKKEALRLSPSPGAAKSYVYSDSGFQYAHRR